MTCVGEIQSMGKSKYVWQSCESCGKERWVQIVKSKPRSKLCKPCAGKESSNRRAYLKGVDHPNWKGGRTHSTTGYVLVLAPNYKRANKVGYVREHILIWETFYKQELPQNWVIHHANGIKYDNRIENLIALPREKHHHYFIIRELQARIRGLESESHNRVWVE